MESFEDFARLQQACLDDGLLARALGKKNLRITRRGTDFVRVVALADEEIASALEEALHTRWLDRREAFVSVVLLARMRNRR